MLDHDAICRLIPHSGDMCLLDSVKAWNDKSITCLTYAHLKKDNPVRNDKGLPMSSLIEFGAQAMAVHGCLLLEKNGGKMEEGYLAALRDVKFSDGYLSDISEELVIHAERLYADAGNMIYEMKVEANDRVLASGRATVVSRFSE